MGNTDTPGQCTSTNLNINEYCFPGGGGPYMKAVGMLVVSLRDVNFGFWSRSGCSGQNTIIFSRKGLL